MVVVLIWLEGRCGRSGVVDVLVWQVVRCDGRVGEVAEQVWYVDRWVGGQV